MAPPTYNDLGKQARDLFSKNYRKKGFFVKVKGSRRSHVRKGGGETSSSCREEHNPSVITDTYFSSEDFGLVKLDVKTKTPTGVDFTVNCVSNNDTGRVNSALETKYF